jgi:4-alpha-glucanotransferase
MNTQELLNQLAIVAGFKTDYVNYQGEKESIPMSRIAKIFSDMGIDTQSSDALHKAIFEMDAKQWLSLLKPCYVVSLGQSNIEFYIPEFAKNDLIKWSVLLEDDTEIEGQLPVLSCQWTGEYHLDGQKYERFRLALNDLPMGYHQLTVQVHDQVMSAKLMVTPEKSWQPKAIEDGAKLWGSAVQLYTVKSERNWGFGDFSDLKVLIKGMAKQGADFVGLNPMHAMFNANAQHCSPYSPSNRQFLNWLYLDIEDLAEYKESKAAQRSVNAKGFQAKIEKARATTEVDYTAVSEMKLSILRKLYKTFLSQHKKNTTPRYKKYQKFVALKGQSLFQQAIYDALYMHFNAELSAYGWMQWPAEFQDHTSEAVMAFAEENAEDVIFWAWVQFICAEQLEAVYKQVKRQKLTLGLYRDLAVGSDRGGAETWVNSNVFQHKLSVGAPPDLLAQQGQNWGLPPLDPQALAEDGYEFFIRLVRSNMESCGALRIDHAMSVFRLWWCPDGEAASEGAYRHYPFEDLLGILNLESHRNECMVIAEDLGTVPDEVAETFPKVGYFSNKVFLFEMPEGACRKPAAYQQKALAMVCNHDMPTLASWWQGSDLELRDTLGLFTKPEFKEMEIHNREQGKKAVLDALNDAELYGKENPSLLDQPLLDAMHQYVGQCESQLMSMQIEDLQLIETPINIPGTSTEYPNWQRKQTLTLEEMFANKTIKKSMKLITLARKM